MLFHNYPLSFVNTPTRSRPRVSILDCCLGSLSFPLASKASWALGTATWAGSTMVFKFERIERTVTKLRRPPRAPGEALIKETTLPLKHAKVASFGTGREAQS